MRPNHNPIITRVPRVAMFRQPKVASSLVFAGRVRGDRGGSVSKGTTLTNMNSSADCQPTSHMALTVPIVIGTTASATSVDGSVAEALADQFEQISRIRRSKP